MHIMAEKKRRSGTLDLKAFRAAIRSSHGRWNGRRPRYSKAITEDLYGHNLSASSISAINQQLDTGLA